MDNADPNDSAPEKALPPGDELKMLPPAAHARTHPEVPQHRRSRGATLAIPIVVGAVALGGVAWYVQAHRGNSGASAGADGKQSRDGKGPGSGSGERAVVVQLATAEKTDVPIWLDGLGTVAAFQQVTVRPQVDGRLDKVTFVEGQPVHKGEVIAQIDPRPFQVALHSAQGALMRDKAQLEANQANLTRYQGLAQQQLVAQQQVEQYAAAVGQYKGLVVIDQAQIEQAQLQLDYAAVKAPLDGITGVRLVDAGNIVHASDSTGLVVITQVDPAAVYFTVPEDYLGAIASAQKNGEVKVQVKSRDGSKLLGEGALAVLDNQVNQTTATLRLKAIVKNDKGAMWPNAFVKARILTETRSGAIVIPAVAVQQGPQGGSFVYVVKDGTAEMTPIVVALITGEKAIIEKGLAGGEQIVVEGANQVKNGGKVETAKKGEGGGEKRSGSGTGTGSGSGERQHGRPTSGEGEKEKK
jgi:multidrug efflux system membrane fusion protein